MVLHLFRADRCTAGIDSAGAEASGENFEKRKLFVDASEVGIDAMLGTERFPDAPVAIFCGVPLSTN